MKKLLVAAVRASRRYIYKAGLRPKPESIFFSPSMNLIYTLRAYAPSKKTMRAIQKAKRGK